MDRSTRAAFLVISSAALVGCSDIDDLEDFDERSYYDTDTDGYGTGSGSTSGSGYGSSTSSGSGSGSSSGSSAPDFMEETDQGIDYEVPGCINWHKDPACGDRPHAANKDYCTVSDKIVEWYLPDQQCQPKDWDLVDNVVKDCKLVCNNPSATCEYAFVAACDRTGAQVAYCNCDP